MKDRPILYKYFENTVEVMVKEYERSKEQNASVNIGTNREIFCSKFLSKVLPPKLRVTSGEIWDSKGNKTGQLDVIINRDDAPALTFGEKEVYLSEGVFAIIGVKSNLTREKLKESINEFKKVNDLKINAGATISSGPQLERPLRIVFAYEGANWDTLLNEIDKQHAQELFDLICILNKGVMIKKGLLLNWPTEHKFSIIEGKASSLGYLYFYLVSYGSSFLGRSLILAPYFEPLNKWTDK